MQGGDQQVAGILIHQADHAEVQTTQVVQNLQHLAQGLLEIERAAQHPADAVQRIQLPLQQFGEHEQFALTDLRAVFGYFVRLSHQK